MVRRPESVALQDFRRLFRGGSLAGLSEVELLERFAADGDEAAFEAIVRRHGPMVLGVCRRMLGDRHAADDAFQATFLVLARRAGAIRDGSRLASWLFGVAHRVARRVRAQESRRRGLGGSELEDLPEPSPSGGSAEEKAEVLQALDDEIARLPEAQRRPIVLCYLSGLTIDQAADCLGIPVGTARSRLARGRDRLRSRLEGRGFRGQSALMTPMLAAWTGRPGPSLPLVNKAVALAVGGATASSKVAAVGLASSPAFFLAEGALRTMTLWKFSTLAAGMVPVLVGGSIGLASVYGPSTGPGPGLGLTAPAAAVAGLDDDDQEAPEAVGDRPLEERRGNGIVVRGRENVVRGREYVELRPTTEAEVARIYRFDGKDLAEVRLRAEGANEAQALKMIIQKLEAELAQMKERLAEAEDEPRDEIEEAEETDRERAEAREVAEDARRQAEEVAAAQRRAIEAAVAAGLQVEQARIQAEQSRLQAEQVVREAKRRAEEMKRQATEARSQARSIAGEVQIKVGADGIARVEGQASEEFEVKTDVVVGRRDGEGERTIILRRQGDIPKPPAPPAPPEAPEAPDAAEAPDAPPAPPEPPTATSVGIRMRGADLEGRLDRIEERLDQLDSLEKKIDRLLDALGDQARSTDRPNPFDRPRAEVPGPDSNPFETDSPVRF